MEIPRRASWPLIIVFQLIALSVPMIFFSGTAFSQDTDRSSSVRNFPRIFSHSGREKNDLPFVTDGLVAWYPFNGNANDLSGNRHHGNTWDVGLASDRNGKDHRSAAFNGRSSWINCGVMDFARGSYSISGWFLANEIDSGLDMDVVGFTDPDNIGAPEGYGILIEIEKKTRFLHRFPFDISGGDDCYCKTVLVPAIWYHFAAVHDANSKALKIYIDGKLETIERRDDSNDFNTRLHLSIGRRGQSYPRYFNGRIDDIAIYDRALNDREVMDLFKGIVP